MQNKKKYAHIYLTERLDWENETQWNYHKVSIFELSNGVETFFSDIRNIAVVENIDSQRECYLVKNKSH